MFCLAKYNERKVVTHRHIGYVFWHFRELDCLTALKLLKLAVRCKVQNLGHRNCVPHKVQHSVFFSFSLAHASTCKGVILSLLCIARGLLHYVLNDDAV